MEDILKKIVDNNRREVDAMMPHGLPAATLPFHRSKRSMSMALAGSPTGIIAEFKRRSPSKGDIHKEAMIQDVIPAYTEAGASACSILTDTPYFGGALTDLAAARQLTDLPILRKDFIVSEFQIQEAAIYGADAILLIAAVLTREEVARLSRYAHEYGLEVLLELHSADELEHVGCDIDMVGINNRNLADFHTDPTLSLKLSKSLPDNIIKVAESGITSMDEVSRLRDAGFSGFLIGERFMMHDDPGKALLEFLNSKNI